MADYKRKYYNLTDEQMCSTRLSMNELARLQRNGTITLNWHDYNEMATLSKQNVQVVCKL